VINGEVIGIGVDLAGQIDVGKETARLERRLKELASQMEQTQKKLANAEFLAKVPPDVLEKTRAKHQEFALERERLSADLQRLRQLAGGAQ